MHASRNRPGQRGASLLSVVTALAILVVTVAVVTQAYRAIDDTIIEGSQRIQAEQNVSHALEGLVRALRLSGTSASGSEIAAAADGRSLVFRQNLGFDGSGIVWSVPLTLERTADGLLMLTEGPGPTSTVLGSGIDPSFRVRLDDTGDRVVVTLGSTLGNQASSTTTVRVTEPILLPN